MPLKLKRRDGSVTPFRNSEYLPFYYFIPRSILQKCGAELNSIPRNSRMVFASREACEFIESDLFKLLIIDATAYMVWHHMGFDEYMEIYSGYDPAWKLAHCPDYWIKEMTDEGIIPTINEMYKNYNCDLGFVPEEEIDVYLRYIVPRVMKKYNMNAAIQVAEEFRCFEDFDFRNSWQKTDFYRKWYHTRTKHPMISLEEFQETYTESHNGQEWEEADTSQDVEENVVSQALVEQFKKTLSEKDIHKASTYKKVGAFSISPKGSKTCLSDRANKNGECWPAIPTICGTETVAVNGTESIAGSAESGTA